jgi:hypothetical protein
MKKFVSLSEFKLANATRGAAEADYLCYIGQEAELPLDFLGALIAILDPTFSIIDDLCLIDQIRGPARYKEYKAQGMPSVEAQYWANLFDTTELIRWVDFDMGHRMARVISRSWQASLHEKQPRRAERSRIIGDRDEGEVFVLLALET